LHENYKPKKEGITYMNDYAVFQVQVGSCTSAYALNYVYYVLCVLWNIADQCMFDSNAS